MRNLGERLKELRENKGLSLYKVYEKTGITNSRLSKAENGAWSNLKLTELKALADLYEISVIPLCIMAGLFEEAEIEGYRAGFRNVALLDDEDKQHIQSQIDYIVKRKR